MTRNILIIVFGIVPASFLSLFAMGIATVGIGMIGNGSVEGWTLLAIGTFAVIGTAALFATVLFRKNVVTNIGLALGCVSAVWALFSNIASVNAGSVTSSVLITVPLVVTLFILGEVGFFGSWLQGKIQRKVG